VAQLADRLLQLLHGAVGATKQPQAFRRERDRPVAAHQQLDAELLFQGVDLPADGRLRQAKILRGHRDAHAAAHRDETTYQVQRR